RSGAFARMEPGDALRLDCIWVAILAASFGALIWLDPAIEPTSVSLTLIWCSGALVGALFSSDRSLVLPLKPVQHTRQWLRSHGKFGLSLAYGVLTDAGARNTVVTAIAPVAGLAQLGGFRFAQSALGLSTIVFSAARAQTLAVLSRQKRVGGLVGLAIVSLALSLIPVLASAALLVVLPL